MTPNRNCRVSQDPVMLSEECVDSETIGIDDENSASPGQQQDAACAMARSRSVNNFDSDKSLLEALVNNEKRSGYDDRSETLLPDWKKPPIAKDPDSSSESDSSMEYTPSDPQNEWDWTVSLDEETSYPQTIKGELNRLKVLRSYHVLDSERDASFERLTGLASRMFHVPICLISLVDLGRQWFLSNRGLGDVRETPRKLAFCAHAIMSKEDLLIVEDATQDDRFKDNPLVTGPPNIRFYAGAPLMSPEGYKLGTLCLIDSKTRPGGLDLEEKQNLSELAALVVDSMVKVRQSKEAAIKEKSAMIACTAHDMLTPLNGVELSLNLLLEERDKLDPSLLELVETASSCCDIMSRTCQQAISRYRRENSSTGRNKVAAEDKNRSHFRQMNSSCVSVTSLSAFDEIVISDLVKNVQKVMEHLPKSVPICVTVDPSVPPVIISDDLKVFRSALNFLTNACRLTTRGSVHFQIRVEEKSNKQVLVFECSDTGPGVPVDMYPNLFKPVDPAVLNQDHPDYEQAMSCIKIDPDSKEMSGGVCHPVAKNVGLGLYSVATNIRSLNGDYGFHPKEGKNGAVFWFSIPLLTPPSSEPGGTTRTSKNEAKIDMMLEPEDAPPVIIPSAPQDSPKSNVNASSAPLPDGTSRTRRALVIDDSVVIRKSVKRALEKLGFSVTQAVDGLQGLKQLQQGIFDLVLCDFLMPVMDGLDCIHQYREWEQVHRPLFRQFIVGISAHASEKDIERGRAAGMDDFVPKPVKLDSLKKLEENSQMNVIENFMDGMAVTADSHSNGNCSPLEAQSGRVMKKRKQDDIAYDEQGHGLTEEARFVCLVAESSASVAQRLSQSIKKLGDWSTVVVNDGQDALRLLKMRQYDAVFLSEDLSTLNAVMCMERFRQWEDQHRVSRQGNVTLLSSDYIPPSMSSGCSTFVYPEHFDGALGKPFSAAELYVILKEATQSVGKRNIVTS